MFAFKKTFALKGHTHLKVQKIPSERRADIHEAPKHTKIPGNGSAIFSHVP